MECIGETIVELKNNTTEAQKEKIQEIFNKNYNIKYITHINNLTYKGDRGCIGIIAIEILRELKNNNLLQCIDKYEIYNYNTNKKDDYLIDE